MSNVRIESELERLREYLREWAECSERWRPTRGLPNAIHYLVDNMKAGVADSSDFRAGPNGWAMTVIDTQLENLAKRIPEAQAVLLVRYLNKAGPAVWRHGRLTHLDQYAVDQLADRVELELMPLVKREGLPL